MSQTVSQNYAYLIRRDGIYYFSRRVPSDLQTRFNKGRVTISLQTRSFKKAEKSAEALSDRLERYWDGLRLEIFHTKELGLSLVESSRAKKTDHAISLDTAVKTYLKLKSDGRSQTFFQATSRAVDYLKQSTAVEQIDEFNPKHASAFRDFLIARGMTSTSVRRVFVTVRTIINLTIREYGLNCKNVFSDVYIPDDDRIDKRPPIPTEVICQIQKECMSIDCVIHSFRHSLRDRLREVECPPDIADAIGGWSSSGIGEQYGSGYSLQSQYGYLQKMERL